MSDFDEAYFEQNYADYSAQNQPGKLGHYRAANRIAPTNLEMMYWHAVTLATNGRVAQSIPLFRKVFAADKRWIDLTRRLRKPGIVPDTAAGKRLIERIVREAGP